MDDLLIIIGCMAFGFFVIFIIPFIICQCWNI